MRNNIINIISSIAIACTSMLLIYGTILFMSFISRISNKDILTEEVKAVEKVKSDSLTDMDLFIMAIAWVESKWIDDAVGQTDDVGYLQITPICVADANRISGNGYTLDDRLSREKSIEIFHIIMNHYGCDTYAEMIRRWNPRAGTWYENKVMDAFNLLMATKNS